MSINRFGLFALPLAAVSLAAFDHPGGGGAPLEAALSGENEVGGGDPDGSGTIKLRFNPGQGEICYTLMTMNVDGVWGAHIHEGVAGVNGSLLINLDLDIPFDGMEEKCVDAPRGLVTQILRDPSGYYVNVHSNDYNAGAVRGQLEGLRDK